MKLHLPKGLRAALLACLLSATGLAHADYTWTGGDTITTDAWKTQGNWTLGEGDTWNIGPMIPDSIMWGAVNIDGATGSVNGLEGWNFKLNLGLNTAADLTIEGIKKLQGGAVIKIGSNSTLTMNLGLGGTGNDGGTVEVTMGSGSVFNMVMHKNKGGDVTNIQLGNIASDSTLGQFNLTAGTDTQTYNTVNFRGTITDGIESTDNFTLHSLTLGSVGTGITLTNLGYEMQGSFTKVDTELTASLADCGKYTVRVGDDGSIKLYYVTGILPGYTWNGTEAEHVWNMSNTNWLNSDGNATAYGDINKTVFRSGTNVSTLVTIGEDITAKRVIIEDDFSFEVATGSAHTLTATDIEVSEGKALTITGDGSLTITADSLKGTLKVESGTLTVTNTLQADTTVTGGTLNGSSISGDVTVTGGVLNGSTMSGDLTVSGGAVTGSVVSGNIAVTGGTVTLSGNNGTTLVQGGTLNIDGSTLDLQVTTSGGSSAISNATEVNVGAGGTLKLTGHDMLGWGANSPAAINLKGSESSQAKLVISDKQGGNAAVMTLSSQLVMKGNALVQAADDVQDCGITVYGSKITASGTGNEISIDLKLREANANDRPTWISDEDWATARSFATFDVAADGELSISGRLMDATGDWITKANVKKIGDGALMIKSDSSSYTGTWNIEGGTLRLESGAVIGNGAIAMAEGTTLESGGTRELANTITGSGALSVLTGGSLTIKGDVTLGKTITNDGTLTIGDGGSLTFTSTSGLDERETVYSDPVETVGSGNGYKSGGFYVVKGGQNAASTTLSTVKLDDKDYVVTVEDDQSAYIVTLPPNGGDYFINTDTVDYGGAGNSAASNATEGLVLNGGNLRMLTSLNDNVVHGIKVQKDATISVADGVAVDDIALTVNDGVKLTLASDGDSLKLDAISGTGTVSSGKDLLVDKGGDFTGSYDGNVRIGTAADGALQKLRADSKLTVIGTAGTVEVTGLNNAAAADNVLGGIDTTGASVRLDNKTDAGVPTKVTLGSASSMDGGVLEFMVSAKEVNTNLAADNKADKPTVITGERLDLSNVTLKVNEVDNMGFAYNTDGPEKAILLFVVSDNDDSTVNNVTVDMSGCSWMSKYFTNFRVVQGSVNVVADANTGIYASHGQTPNGTAGLALAGKAMFRLNPQTLTPDSELAQVLDMLDNHIATGNSGAMDRLGAALAGSSLSAVGLALADDVQRQLRSIRNRTTTMGVNECVVNEDMPYVNGWISGDGNYRQLSESGTDAGYQVSSWGGTVGVDVDVNPNLTLGVAVSALFGDYTGKSADTLTGDLDTQYVSLFARVSTGSWVNTFVGTLGRADVDLERTIPGVTGKTTYKTNGMMFGFLYEIARTFALNEDASTCVQPLFNMSFTHTSLDSATEGGTADTRLTTDSASLTQFSLGLGGRLQSIVGENEYNRASIFEARALLKLDFGDRYNKLNTALAALPNATVSTRSNESGVIGAEVGATLTIPLSQDAGSIFFDVNADFRADQAGVNGSVGYRVNF